MNRFLLSLTISFTATQLAACAGSSNQESQYDTPKKQEQSLGQQPETAPKTGSTPTANEPQPNQNTTKPAEPTSNSGETLQPKPAVPPQEALALLQKEYDAELNSIIDSRCQICHGSIKNLNFSDFKRLTSDAALMADAVSKGRMPSNPSVLPSEEKKKLLSFLTALEKLSQ